MNALRHGCDSLTVVVEETVKVRIRFENQTKEPVPENLQRVFERCYKTDEARTGTGSGLGLCIVKALVEEMNGTVMAYDAGNSRFGILVELESMNTRV